ncbi:glycoside hydrolase family 31 protein [Zophobihabitans entericus]|uniref:Glycoside hydrolase family 31 protein n=1 Tax=Zophobihabitans entericus TaxID=1635327 RepID=A0A6G9I885_9GAMM|nr:glycoside hydrolase family 31 protein [Zophobihabitans entericus]QIQ20423.1 glycoside hydrolase family 31 protein [Zophobihabitans entericus]
MKTLKNWQFKQQDNDCIELLVDDKYNFCIYVLEQKLFRVLIKRNNQLSLDRTWSIAPTQDTPIEGRDRLSTEGFSLPVYQLSKSDDKIIISTEQLRVTVTQPLTLTWEYKNASDEWELLVADRGTGAYLLNAHGDGIAHYQRRYKDEQYYGLGEKAGDLNRAGRRFEMRNLDAMGYNAKDTDPLYKHIPFTITRRNEVSFGLFYDNLSCCWLDLGKELDNYHLSYRRYQAEAGDIDYYLFVGPKVLDVTKSFVQLTGKTFFGPKWSLGYSGSTMHYTDAPNAQEQLQEFIKLCKEHGIPCDSFQLSSGYTSIGNKRYVFNWNYDKVPQPKVLSKAFHDNGFRLAANIKPCLLQDHPKYQEAAAQGLFIKDSESDNPERSVFWDDEGSHLDFTNPKAFNWWKTNVTKQLLEMGIDSTWNDNNEYEVWDGEARCYGFGKEIPIKHIRPVMPLLMCRSSMEAQQKFAPTIRPYLISRSGCAGMQRYVQTWSGDNRTSWQTLRYNTRMGVGMSLSGLYNVGHDVGGFSGNKPDPELFVRWVQNGIMHPRFTIHSWNDDKTVNEPWMYPEITPIIRDTICLRYELLPYFYNLLWQAHNDDEPMLRPTFLDHEHDVNTFAETDDFLIGKDILVASVVEQGQRERTVYLPDNETGWYCFHTHQWFTGKQSITLPAPLETLPLLVRAGSIIPTAKRMAYVNHKEDNYREFRVFPAKGVAKTTGSFFEDDGESYGYQKDQALWIDWKMSSTNERIDLTLKVKGKYVPAWKELAITLPKDEKRPIYINNKVMDKVALQTLK